MLTERVRSVMVRLGRLPERIQERFATAFEVVLDQEEAQQGSEEQTRNKQCQPHKQQKGSQR